MTTDIRAAAQALLDALDAHRLDLGCESYQRGANFDDAVGGKVEALKAVLAAPAAKGGAKNRATGLIAKLARASERLRDNPIPGMVRGDLYVAVKNEGQGTGWRYVYSGALVSDLDEARALASPPPPAGAAGGGSGDLGALRSAAQAVLDAIIADGPGVGEPGYPDDDAYNLDDKGKMRLKTGLVRALRDALSAPTPDLGAQGDLAALSVPDSVRQFVQHCEEKVYPLVTGCWALNRSQADAFIDVLNAARSDLADPAAPRSGSGVTVEEIARTLLDMRGFGFYTDPMEGGQNAYDLSCEALNEADAILALLQAPRPGETGANQAAQANGATDA